MKAAAERGEEVKAQRNVAKEWWNDLKAQAGMVGALAGRAVVADAFTIPMGNVTMSETSAANYMAASTVSK